MVIMLINTNINNILAYISFDSYLKEPKVIYI